MTIKVKNSFAFLMLFLMIFSIPIHNNINHYFEPAHEELKLIPPYLKLAGFWNNFTFIHITNLNWTIANETDWCSGSGTWGNPYLIENMIINASDSPTGTGIFIENSTNVYFTIRNVTIFEATDGIKLENTNNGAIINNSLSDNLDSGISLVNCVNNTILRNILINNEVQGIYLFTNCNENKIIGNTAINDGTNLQDTGIHLEGYCNDNEIMENDVWDNNIYGINIEDFCERNLIHNNTVGNRLTSLQDYGIRLDSNCDQNTISSNLIEDLNSYGIGLVTSDKTLASNNQIIDCLWGIYMLWAPQSEIISNTISSCSLAITMSACDGGQIIGNFINNTGSYAINININCDDNEFHDNIIKDNNIGVQLGASSDINNTFYRNSFISNIIHAIDNGTANPWNNTVVGNYWDTYTGLDLNNDHIGDVPFNISGAANATDSLPIVDHDPPTIIINTPTPKEYNATAPEFNIVVNETYLYSLWYTINNSGEKYYITENGTINQDAWDALGNGTVIIAFYARDIAWKLGSNSVVIIKNTSSQVPNGPDDPGDGPPSLDPIIIIVISIIVISVIIIAAIVLRKPIMGKIKKQRKLNEEQVSEAQYFQDVTSILTILAIHNDSGLCLSKIAVHGGIGLDENLFTGFISAMGSFKNELAEQMGLRVQGGSGDNTIEYNEFTITLMDGESLRLGLVSYSSLGDLIKERCGQVLRDYEVKHLNDLKNFDGEIQVFDDFKEIIETGLDMNLNKRSIINVKQLNKYDAPESFLTVLKDLNSRSEGFYPAEISLILVQELKISDQEANFMVFEAYKNQLFLPINKENG
ncbi:MAG: right-handed parallel beta-helix repeat-containing protein [Promethearchaeota archaeon]|jgi:parallel beta-helix repeat protein